MASVEIKSVVKSYGAVHVLHGVTISIPDASFVALVGPSGCGKSTLLRMIAGLEDVSGGDIMIGDRRVNDLDPKDRDIAMVFQNYALYPHMSVAENMGFSLRLAGVPKADRALQVAKAAEILDLTPLLTRYPRQLSGGQRQRVAMGRAIVRNPAVFLFDEPLSNLDAKLRVAMRAEIKALHQRLKTTTIYVTHDQVEAMTMADLVVVMNGGRVAQIGAPLDLYDRPDNLFVAGFIGSPAMNLIDAQITSRAGKLLIAVGEALFTPPEGALVQDGQEVVLGVRPEHLQLLETGPAGGGLLGEVQVIEPTGAETHVILKAGAVTLTAVFRDRLTLSPKDQLRLAPMPGTIHLFDRKTGARI